MKALVALLLLAVGAGSVWAYGMMGSGMMGRSVNGGSQDFWGYMAAMHNWMHGTNYTTSQFEQDWNATAGGVHTGGMMGGADDIQGGFGCR